MMRYPFLARRLQLFHRVIQKEIYKDSINLCLWVLPQYIPPNKLHTPNTASTQLNLPRRAALNLLFLTDGKIQLRTIHQAAKAGQDLRHAVVGKHGDLVNVSELAVAGAFEAGPEIGDEDLGSFQESNAFSSLETCFVVEAGESAGEEIHERGG